MIQKSQAQPSVQAKPFNPYADLVAADCQHWKSLIARINEPKIAQLLVEYLDSEPDLRVKRSGVYLAAHETLERAEQANAAVRLREEQAAAYGRRAAFLVKGAVKVVRWSVLVLHSACKAACSSLAEASKAPNVLPRTEPVRGAQADQPVENMMFPKIDLLTDGLEASSAAAPQGGAKILHWPHIQWPEGQAAGQAAVH